MMRVICTAVKFVVAMAAFISVLVGLGVFFSWLGGRIGVTRQDVTMWSAVLMLVAMTVALAQACWASCAPKPDRRVVGRNGPPTYPRPPPPPNPPPPPDFVETNR